MGLWCLLRALLDTMLRLVLIATALAHAHQNPKSAAATSLVGEKNVKTQAKKEAPVPEGELDSHKGMQGEMSYHGYDEDWHTEYKGEIHEPQTEQKEAFKKGFLHKEYVKNGPSDFAGLSSIAAMCAVALLNA